VVNVRTNGGPGASSDFADVFQGIVIEVDELLCAEVEMPSDSRQRARFRKCMVHTIWSVNESTCTEFFISKQNSRMPLLESNLF
jgi:hypothetical protein